MYSENDILVRRARRTFIPDIFVFSSISSVAATVWTIVTSRRFDCFSPFK